MNAKSITVQTTVNAPIDKVWECWTKPEHITQWAFAQDDWEAPAAENDVRTGGAFKTRMQSKDGKEGFDFTGVYTNVAKHERIEYDMDDGRHVSVVFEETPGGVLVKETFDPEHENPETMQRDGWQAILDNFKLYVEEN
jgi:uncharacterized protein YndB with AHSA1/START domain